MPHKNYKRNRRGAPRYYKIWLTALVIFAAVFLASKSGLGDKLENLVAGAANEQALSSGVVSFILPVPVQTEPSQPAADSEPSAPPPDTDAQISFESTISPDELPAAPVEELAIFESVLPSFERSNAHDAPPVSSITISGEGENYQGGGHVYIKNETKYTIDTAALIKKKSPVKLSGSGAQVLIMHTHGTEAYTADKNSNYVESDPYRTTDSDFNVLRVGEEIASILRESGIKVIHSTVLNDYPAYNGSYSRALNDISAILKENPSIKVVIDVHRDAMVSQNGTVYKTVADIDGKSAAQLMFVVGTDDGGLKHDNWRDNLTFQALIQARMNEKYPGIMRPMSIRTGRFNQHVTKGSMLLEVGTSGNSLSEAVYSAGLFARELADMFNGK